MIPNLYEATRSYWRQLDELEAAYQRDEVSLAEVDAKVADLMAELGRERRATLRLIVENLSYSWQAHREWIISIALIGSLTYAWFVVSQAS